MRAPRVPKCQPPVRAEPLAVSAGGAVAGKGLMLWEPLAGLLIEAFGLSALMSYLCALGGSFFLLQLAALRFLGQRA